MGTPQEQAQHELRQTEPSTEILLRQGTADDITDTADNTTDTTQEQAQHELRQTELSAPILLQGTSDNTTQEQRTD